MGPVVRIKLSIKESALNVAAHSLRSQPSSSIPVHLNGRCPASAGPPESMLDMIYVSNIRFVSKMSKTSLGKITNDLLLAPD